MKPNEEIKEATETEQTTPSSKNSVMINTCEKKNAVDYGFSLDKRMPKCTPIYSDIHKTCFSLAQAILRHTKFSRGMLFLEDLAHLMRGTHTVGSAHKYRNEIANKIELTPSHNRLKFNYCFNENLKFEQSVAQPRYLMQRGETIESLKKELNFEAGDDEDIVPNDCHLIKFNLSDSENSDKDQESLLRTFTFRQSDKKDPHIEVKSVIHEEKDEMNESKAISLSEGSTSPVKRINLMKASPSSPSIASSCEAGLFKMNMLKVSNRGDSPVKHNVFSISSRFNVKKASAVNESEQNEKIEDQSEYLSSDH